MALAGVGLVGSGLQPAEAVTAGVLQPGVPITGVTSWGESWLGAMKPPNGVEDLYFCVQSGNDDPVGYTPVGTEIVSDAQLAWIYETKRGIADATSRAAISYLTHMRHETQGASAVSPETRKARIEANAPQAVKDVAAAYLAEAAVQAGPFRGSTSTVVTADKRTGAINNLGFLSDAGNWIAGKPIRVTLTGPAVFDTTGTNIWEGTTLAGPISLSWTATGNGTVTPVVEIGGAGRVTLTKYSMSGAVQDGLSYAGRPPSDPEELTTAGTPFDVVLDFQPEVRTQVATVFVAEGESLVDQVTAAAAAGDVWTQVGGSYVPVVAEGTLYGPFAEQPAQSSDVPADAPAVATETLTFNGPGTLDSPSTLRASEAGYYTWVWSIKKASQSASVAQYIRGDATHDFGLVAETHIVPFTPTITTQVEDRYPELATEDLVDVLTFGVATGPGWLAKQNGSPVETVWDGTLYGPFDVPVSEAADVPAGAQVYGHDQLVVDGTGTERLPATASSAAGFYTWVWEMDKARQPVESQPYLADSVQTAFMIEAETHSVKHPVSLTSMMVDFNVVQGGQLRDVITQSGFPDSHTEFRGLGGWEADGQEVVHTAYGPLAEQPTADLDLSTAPVLGVDTTPAQNGTYVVGTEGEYPIADSNAGAGWYVIVSTWAGDDRVEPLATSPGDPLEHAYVPYDETTEVETWLVTDADERVVAGQPFKDTAHLTGTIHAGGYLEFEAYGPFVAGVEAVESAESLLWTSEQIPVTAAGTFRSGYTTTDLPETAAWGDVYWVATYYDADGQVVVRGAFGDPSEITRVTAPERPVVTTLAQPMVALGDPAYDVAYVSGPVEPESVLTWAAYRQADSDDLADDELVAEIGPVTIYHGGTYESPAVVFDEVGTYYWVETLTGPDGEVVHVGEPRLPAETTQVVRVTTQALKEIAEGEAARDVALIEGTPVPGSTLTFAVYRQAAGTDVADDELVATLDPVEITGPGEVRSADVTLDRYGTYYWVETLTGPDGEVVHVGEPRLPAETTTVVVQYQDSAAAAANSDQARALAVTGAKTYGLLLGAALLIALGAGQIGYVRSRRQGTGARS
ncbi:hypothetical protein KQI48_00865 [Cellulomonas hominis]|uniref:hypothetical protein n=1 Tax=Cellulomonas hominis TaxID=156981 RepID=UPI001C128982|nr:hypothetical protein [Cellulomonas hominis]MBU5421206.1 hypothetical protein [Cellulomonas hominis]